MFIPYMPGQEDLFVLMVQNRTTLQAAGTASSTPHDILLWLPHYVSFFSKVITSTILSIKSSNYYSYYNIRKRGKSQHTAITQATDQEFIPHRDIIIADTIFDPVQTVIRISMNSGGHYI
jgi:hypothetical protein